MEATDHVPETLSADLNQISSIEEMMPVLRFMFASLEVQEDDDEFSIRTNWMRWSAEQFSTRLDGTRPAIAAKLKPEQSLHSLWLTCVKLANPAIQMTRPTAETISTYLTTVNANLVEKMKAYQQDQEASHNREVQPEQATSVNAAMYFFGDLASITYFLLSKAISAVNLYKATFLWISEIPALKAAVADMQMNLQGRSEVNVIARRVLEGKRRSQALFEVYMGMKPRYENFRGLVDSHIPGTGYEEVVWSWQSLERWISDKNMTSAAYAGPNQYANILQDAVLGERSKEVEMCVNRIMAFVPSEESRIANKRERIKQRIEDVVGNSRELLAQDASNPLKTATKANILLKKIQDLDRECDKLADGCDYTKENFGMSPDESAELQEQLQAFIDEDVKITEREKVSTRLQAQEFAKHHHTQKLPKLRVAADFLRWLNIYMEMCKTVTESTLRAQIIKGSLSEKDQKHLEAEMSADACLKFVVGRFGNPQLIGDGEINRLKDLRECKDDEKLMLHNSEVFIKTVEHLKKFGLIFRLTEVVRSQIVSKILTTVAVQQMLNDMEKAEDQWEHIKQCKKKGVNPLKEGLTNGFLLQEGDENDLNTTEGGQGRNSIRPTSSTPNNSHNSTMVASSSAIAHDNILAALKGAEPENKEMEEFKRSKFIQYHKRWYEAIFKKHHIAKLAARVDSQPAARQPRRQNNHSYSVGASTQSDCPTAGCRAKHGNSLISCKAFKAASMVERERAVAQAVKICKRCLHYNYRDDHKVVNNKCPVQAKSNVSCKTPYCKQNNIHLTHSPFLCKYRQSQSVGRSIRGQSGRSRGFGNRGNRPQNPAFRQQSYTPRGRSSYTAGRRGGSRGGFRGNSMRGFQSNFRGGRGSRGGRGTRGGGRGRSRGRGQFQFKRITRQQRLSASNKAYNTRQNQNSDESHQEWDECKSKNCQIHKPVRCNLITTGDRIRAPADEQTQSSNESEHESDNGNTDNQDGKYNTKTEDKVALDSDELQDKERHETNEEKSDSEINPVDGESGRRGAESTNEQWIALGARPKQGNSVKMILQRPRDLEPGTVIKLPKNDDTLEDMLDKGSDDQSMAPTIKSAMEWQKVAWPESNVFEPENLACFESDPQHELNPDAKEFRPASIKQTEEQQQEAPAPFRVKLEPRLQNPSERSPDSVNAPSANTSDQRGTNPVPLLLQRPSRPDPTRAALDTPPPPTNSPQPSRREEIPPLIVDVETEDSENDNIPEPHLIAQMEEEFERILLEGPNRALLARAFHENGTTRYTIPDRQLRPAIPLVDPQQEGLMRSKLAGKQGQQREEILLKNEKYLRTKAGPYSPRITSVRNLDHAPREVDSRRQMHSQGEMCIADATRVTGNFFPTMAAQNREQGTEERRQGQSFNDWRMQGWRMAHVQRLPDLVATMNFRAAEEAELVGAPYPHQAGVCPDISRARAIEWELAQRRHSNQFLTWENSCYDMHFPRQHPIEVGAAPHHVRSSGMSFYPNQPLPCTEYFLEKLRRYRLGCNQFNMYYTPLPPLINHQSLMQLGMERPPPGLEHPRGLARIDPSHLLSAIDRVWNVRRGREWANYREPIEITNEVEFNMTREEWFVHVNPGQTWSCINEDERHIVTREWRDRRRELSNILYPSESPTPPILQQEAAGSSSVQGSEQERKLRKKPSKTKKKHPHVMMIRTTKNMDTESDHEQKPAPVSSVSVCPVAGSTSLTKIPHTATEAKQMVHPSETEPKKDNKRQLTPPELRRPLAPPWSILGRDPLYGKLPGSYPQTADAYEPHANDVPMKKKVTWRDELLPWKDIDGVKAEVTASVRGNAKEIAERMAMKGEGFGELSLQKVDSEDVDTRYELKAMPHGSLSISSVRKETKVEWGQPSHTVSERRTPLPVSLFQGKEAETWLGQVTDEQGEASWNSRSHRSVNHAPGRAPIPPHTPQQHNPQGADQVASIGSDGSKLEDYHEMEDCPLKPQMCPPCDNCVTDSNAGKLERKFNVKHKKRGQPFAFFHEQQNCPHRDVWVPPCGYCIQYDRQGLVVLKPKAYGCQLRSTTRVTPSVSGPKFAEDLGIRITAHEVQPRAKHAVARGFRIAPKDPGSTTWFDSQVMHSVKNMTVLFPTLITQQHVKERLNNVRRIVAGARDENLASRVFKDKRDGTLRMQDMNTLQTLEIPKNAIAVAQIEAKVTTYMLKEDRQMTSYIGHSAWVDDRVRAYSAKDWQIDGQTVKVFECSKCNTDIDISLQQDRHRAQSPLQQTAATRANPSYAAACAAGGGNHQSPSDSVRIMMASVKEPNSTRCKREQTDHTYSRAHQHPKVQQKKKKKVENTKIVSRTRSHPQQKARYQTPVTTDYAVSGKIAGCGDIVREVLIHLDSGSQCNFIINSTAVSIGLKPKNEYKGKISTLTSVTRQHFPVYDVQLMNEYGDLMCPIEAQGVPDGSLSEKEGRPLEFYKYLSNLAKIPVESFERAEGTYDLLLGNGELKLILGSGVESGPKFEAAQPKLVLRKIDLSPKIITGGEVIEENLPVDLRMVRLTKCISQATVQTNMVKPNDEKQGEEKQKSKSHTQKKYPKELKELSKRVRKALKSKQDEKNKEGTGSLLLDETDSSDTWQKSGEQSEGRSRQASTATQPDESPVKIWPDGRPPIVLPFEYEGPPRLDFLGKPRKEADQKTNEWPSSVKELTFPSFPAVGSFLKPEEPITKSPVRKTASSGIRRDQTAEAYDQPPPQPLPENIYERMQRVRRCRQCLERHPWTTCKAPRQKESTNMFFQGATWSAPQRNEILVRGSAFKVVYGSYEPSSGEGSCRAIIECVPERCNVHRAVADMQAYCGPPKGSRSAYCTLKKPYIPQQGAVSRAINSIYHTLSEVKSELQADSQHTQRSHREYAEVDARVDACLACVGMSKTHSHGCIEGQRKQGEQNNSADSDGQIDDEIDMLAEEYAEIEAEITEVEKDPEWPNQSIFMIRGDHGKVTNPLEKK